MSPRRRKAENADVFAAMVRVMMRVGPAELTLGAIAAEAGITAGALVQRFGSKRELMLAHARYAAATGRYRLWPPGQTDQFPAARNPCEHRDVCPVGRLTPRRRAESCLPVTRPGGPGTAP